MYRFEGADCVKQLFLEWLETLTKDGQQPLTVLAHNFQGYDGHFCVKENQKQAGLIDGTLNGAKILQLTLDDIHFINSLSFFQMPLSGIFHICLMYQTIKSMWERCLQWIITHSSTCRSREEKSLKSGTGTRNRRTNPLTFDRADQFLWIRCTAFQRRLPDL